MAVASIRTLSELFLVHSANTPDEDPSQRDRVENKTNKNAYAHGACLLLGQADSRQGKTKLVA